MQKTFLLIFVAAVALSAQVREGRNGFYFPGQTSGGLGMVVANVAGTPVTLVLPTDSSSATTGKILSLGDVTSCPALRPSFFPTTCRALSWTTASSSSSYYIPIPVGGWNTITESGVAVLTSDQGVGSVGSGSSLIEGQIFYLNGTSSFVMVKTTMPAATSLDLLIGFRNAQSSTVGYSISTYCPQTGHTFGTITYNAAQTLSWASGTALQKNTLTNLTTTGCSEGDMLLIKIQSTSNPGIDNYQLIMKMALKVHI